MGVLAKIKKGKDPFQELRKVFAKCGQISFEKNLQALKTLQATSPSPPTLESIVQCLVQESPVFAKAWALVNRDEKLKMIDMSTNHELLGPAYYDANLHTINIKKSLDIYFKTHAVIFEVMNALQKEHLMQIHQLGRLGELSREEFTLLIENLEYETLRWTQQIAGMSLPSFTEVWKSSNIPVSPSKNWPKGYHSHADASRKKWDYLCAAPYLKKHPELDVATATENSG